MQRRTNGTNADSRSSARFPSRVGSPVCIPRYTSEDSVCPEKWEREEDRLVLPVLKRDDLLLSAHLNLVRIRSECDVTTWRNRVSLRSATSRARREKNRLTPAG